MIEIEIGEILFLDFGFFFVMAILKMPQERECVLKLSR